MLMSTDQPAAVYFEPNGFRIVRPGAFVLCAVSGERIPLDVLRYWSANFQEAYASPEIATRRLLPDAV